MKRVLHMGQRLALLLLIVLTISIAILWWFLPDLKTIHPEIENYLKEEMSLQSLDLGEPSWQWKNGWGLRFKNSSLLTSDHLLNIQNSDITAYITIYDLITGGVLPKVIQLQSGSIHLRIPKTESSEKLDLPPLQLILEDVHVYWQYHQQSSDFQHVHLNLNLADQNIIASAKGLKIKGYWGYNKLFNITFDHLDWLPEVWKKPIQGTLSGNILLQQLENSPWLFQTKLKGSNDTALYFPEADFHFPFDEVSFGLEFTSDLSSNDSFAVETININYMDWKFKKNQVNATGVWQQGVLKINAKSPYFEMPVMWSFLHPIDTGPWDKWLDLMQHGAGYDSTGGVVLNWDKPWQAPPSMKDLSNIHYYMKGVTKDADVFLGMEDAITHTYADVSFDENGLEAIVHDTELPHGIGHAYGRFYIAWDTLVLEVDGKSKRIDAGKMHAWLDEKNAAYLQYGDMPASGDIDLVWMPLEDQPRSCILTLKPIAPWNLQPMDIPVKVTDGLVIWDLKKGVQLHNMDLSIDQFFGRASISTQLNAKSGNWELSSLNSNLKINWSKIIRDYRVPIESPSGIISTSLRYKNKAWSGSIDASKAAWRNFLGSEKKIGEAFQLVFRSIQDKGKRKKNTLAKLHVQTDNPFIQLDATGIWEPSGIHLQLGKLHAPSFDGELSVWAPFKPASPIELSVVAKYLNRTALPPSLPKITGTKITPWELNSSVDVFEWGTSQIHQAHIRLSSAQYIHGRLQAKTAHVEDVKIQGIDTSFALMGGGRIDLHHVTGSIDQHKFNISGSVEPTKDDALKWTGFAKVNGNFGELMKQTSTSKLFEDGQMNLFFSGSGLVVRNSPWWQDLNGRLRLHVKNGRIMEGGALSKLLAAISLFDFPLFLVGQRADLTSKGLLYRNMEVESIFNGKDVDIRKFILRSSAMDIAGTGDVVLDKKLVDMILVVRPFQNIDAILSIIPIVRNILGGNDYSFIRKIYHMHGPFKDTSVDSISPKEAGVASSGLIETILTLPQILFSNKEKSP